MDFGSSRLDVISGGPFKLDGGGMFGVIPKPLWEREFQADHRNRIQMDTNCALVRRDSEVILVDTGNGTKLHEKEREIFGIDDSVTLLGSLAALGLQPRDVTRVIYTHLHMDHAGGGTLVTECGDPRPSFPNARYYVQRVEWEDALANRSHMRISYRAENLLPLQESGRLELLDGDVEVVTGVRTRVTGGHTRGHQVVLFQDGGVTAACFGDVMPTTAHLRGPYQMAFDISPYETMQAKRRLSEEAAREEWAVVWDHDPRLRCGRILSRGGERYEAEPLEG